MAHWIEAIEEAAQTTSFSGAVSISQRGRLLYADAFGYRNRSERLVNHIDTRFGTASGTKLFTALGIAKLVEDGKLTFDTRVREISTDFHTFIDPDASIADILTHRSGVFDYYDEEIVTGFDNFFAEIPWYQLETPADYLPLFTGQQMKFTPGARFSYSNGGYILLGIIIEMLSDLLYRDFITEKILAPAGMVDSGFPAFNDLPENTALGYMAEGNATNIYNLPIRGASDGGMYTTLNDMSRFWHCFMAGKIVSSEIAGKMQQIHAPFEANSGYGYGLYLANSDSGKRMVYIVGGDAGVGFHSAYIAASDSIITILANITDGEEEMRRTVYRTLADETII